MLQWVATTPPLSSGREAVAKLLPLREATISGDFFFGTPLPMETGGEVRPVRPPLLRPGSRLSLLSERRIQPLEQNRKT